MAKDRQFRATMAEIKSQLLTHFIKIMQKFQEHRHSGSQGETHCHLNLGHFAGTFTSNKTSDSFRIRLILNQLK